MTLAGWENEVHCLVDPAREFRFYEKVDGGWQRYEGHPIDFFEMGYHPANPVRRGSSYQCFFHGVKPAEFVNAFWSSYGEFEAVSEDHDTEWLITHGGFSLIVAIPAGATPNWGRLLQSIPRLEGAGWPSSTDQPSALRSPTSSTDSVSTAPEI